MLGGRLQLHQIDHVHDADFEIGEFAPQDRDRRQSLQRRDVARAGHDYIRLRPLVVAGPFPEAYAFRAMLDGLVAGEPLRRRMFTGDHDVDTKINQARRFLEHKDKVLLNVLFRGRELQHVEEGKRIIEHMVEKLLDVAKVEKAPSMEGKRMTAMLAPKGN